MTTQCVKTSEVTPINNAIVPMYHIELPSDFYFITFYYHFEQIKEVRVVKSIKNRTFIICLPK